MKAMMFFIVVLFGMKNTTAQERAVQLQQMIKLKLQSRLDDEKNNNNKRGLNEISQHRNATLTLFDNYFSSLLKVNGNIRNSDKVQDIKTMNQAVRRTFEVTIKNVGGSGFYQQSEIEDLNRTYTKVLSDCREILRNLDMVIISGQYKMTDAQRLQRIDQLYDRMVGVFRFTKSFCADLEVLRFSRQRERMDIETLRGLHGTN